MRSLDGFHEFFNAPLEPGLNLIDLTLVLRVHLLIIEVDLVPGDDEILQACENLCLDET
jgi:hypothetical protein